MRIKESSIQERLEGQIQELLQIPPETTGPDYQVDSRKSVIAGVTSIPLWEGVVKTARKRTSNSTSGFDGSVKGLIFEHMAYLWHWSNRKPGVNLLTPVQSELFTTLVTKTTGHTLYPPDAVEIKYIGEHPVALALHEFTTSGFDHSRYFYSKVKNFWQWQLALPRNMRSHLQLVFSTPTRTPEERKRLRLHVPFVTFKQVPITDSELNNFLGKTIFDNSQNVIKPGV